MMHFCCWTNIRRKMRSRRNLFTYILYIFLISIGYKLRDMDVVTGLIKAFDHHYIVVKRFCLGSIEYTKISQDHYILLSTEIVRLYRTLEVVQQNIQNKSLLTDIDNSMDLIKNTISRKYNSKVCPEILHMVTLDKRLYSYISEDEKCVNDPETKYIVKELVTFIFDLTGDSCASIEGRNKLFKNLRRSYPDSHIIIGIDNTIRECVGQVSQRVTIVTAKQGQKNIWNEMIGLVRTPYVFVGRDVVDFDDASNLDRLLREIAVLSAEILGGSIRTLHDGHWFLNCYHIEHKNYKVKIVKGYYHSHHDCLYCRYFRGPFLAKTEFLRMQFDKFNRPTESGIAFLDLFFNNLRTGKVAAVCPDVVFHTSPSSVEAPSYNAWLTIAQKYEFAKVTDEVGHTHTFPCNSLNIVKNDDNIDKTVHPCILQRLSKMVKYFMSVVKKNNIQSELTVGSLLGAIKFYGILPWDYDADILFHPDNASAIANLKDTFQQQGYTLIPGKHEGKQYFDFDYSDSTGHYRIDVWPLFNKSSITPVGRRKAYRSSMILMDDEWIQVPYNPAKEARDTMGPEVFRHTTSRTLCGFGIAAGTKPADMDGSFPVCSEGQGHSCLDQYHTDGNIQFLGEL